MNSSHRAVLDEGLQEASGSINAKAVQCIGNLWLDESHPLSRSAGMRFMGVCSTL